MQDIIDLILKLERLPGWIKFIPERHQDKVAAVHDTLLLLYEKEKNNWQKQQQKIREDIWQMKQENPDFDRKARIRYLRDRLNEKITQFNEMRKRYIHLRKTRQLKAAERLAKEAEGVAKAMLGYRRALEAVKTNRKDEITPEMIEHAREFPIKNIIEVNDRGFAKCLWHEEKTSSMFTKNNFVHCFGCGHSGDSIDVYRAMTGASFPEAVKMLQK